MTVNAAFGMRDGREIIRNAERLGLLSGAQIGCRLDLGVPGSLVDVDAYRDAMEAACSAAGLEVEWMAT